MTEQTAPIPHDPNARLDYGWDWVRELDAGETITNVTATGSNVTSEAASVIGTQTVAWVSGGTPGRASVRFHITTSAGRQDDRTLQLWVRER